MGSFLNLIKSAFKAPDFGIMTIVKIDNLYHKKKKKNIFTHNPYKRSSYKTIKKNVSKKLTN